MHVSIIAIILFIMAKRSSCSSTSPLTKPERLGVRSELVAVANGAPKRSVARILQTLRSRGLLDDVELGGDDEPRQLSIASHEHADSMTPYETVVQDVGLEMNDGSIFK